MGRVSSLTAAAFACMLRRNLPPRRVPAACALPHEAVMSPYQYGASHWHASIGHVEVICGPMFSGKTEELIKRLRRAGYARQRVMVFKPRIDTRYDDEQIVSHSAQRLESLPVDDVAEMKSILDQQRHAPEVVGIDEAQFFDDDLVDFVEGLAEDGTRVVIAGLDQDYSGNPFTPMPTLLALADDITKQLAVCVVCGAPASKSQRVNPMAAEQLSLGSDFLGADGAGTQQVLVGAHDAYEARCRKCWSPNIDTPHLPRGVRPRED